MKLNSGSPYLVLKSVYYYFTSIKFKMTQDSHPTVGKLTNHGGSRDLLPGATNIFVNLSSVRSAKRSVTTEHTVTRSLWKNKKQ